MDRDVVIQKYLTGHSSQLERDWLLGELLKFYNGVLILLSKRRMEEG